MTVSELMRQHYEQCFHQHGANSQGVDWGNSEERLALRYKKILDIILLDPSPSAPSSILDVGCGFGGLYSYAQTKGIDLDYTGIDITKSMIDYARDKFGGARFICDDFAKSAQKQTYDYVVCNGIFTQKLSTPVREMNVYFYDIVQKMFSLSNRGIAFNIMTSNVNYYAENLFYKNPLEIMATTFKDLSSNIVINHACSPLYEFFVYIYKDI